MKKNNISLSVLLPVISTPLVGGEEAEEKTD